MRPVAQTHLNTKVGPMGSGTDSAPRRPPERRSSFQPTDKGLANDGENFGDMVTLVFAERPGFTADSTTHINLAIPAETPMKVRGRIT